MRKAIGAAILLAALPFQLFATWSIIIIDPKTKEIGIAGASCTDDCSGIGSIIPGTGAIIVQALSNFNAHDMGRKAIIAGHNIEDILEALKEPRFDPQHQQYALVTVRQMNPVTYTGDSVIAFCGAVASYGVSVQGNLLATKEELDDIMNAIIKAQKDSLPLREVLMLALQAGSKAGGDRRCGDQRSRSAFIKVASPADDADNPSLNIVITQSQNQNSDAVAILSSEYEKWKKKKS